MKKWKRKALALGVASALIVPSFSTGAEASYKTVYKAPAKSPSVDLPFIQNNQEYYSKDTLVINYSKKLSSSDHRHAGTSLVKSYPQLGYDVVKLNKGQKLAKVLQAYKANGSVKSVAPSAIFKPFKTAADPKTSDMYHLKQLNVEKAQQLAGKNEVIVAVIDSWVDSDHPELKNRVLPAYNVANPTKQGTKDSHGTHVSGIIASEKGNGIGGYGINPNAKILPINVFDGYNAGSDYIIAEAILYAVDKGAKVINMSLGGYFESKIMEDAVKKALDKGVTIVAAAGNESTNMYSIPAAYEGVISVGATNDKKELAYFSNYGPSVNLVAPGENVYNATHYSSTNQSAFTEMSGTSMASPVVAGVASLILSKYPDLTPYQVRALLEETASDLGAKGYDLKFGNGLVNPVAALSYDISKLPKEEKHNDKERLQLAEEQSLEEGQAVLKGKLTKPAEEKLYKINVTKDQPVQMILKGSKDFDYRAKLYFYPEGQTKAKLPINVNDAKAGGIEGYAYVPKESGTLVVSVSDYNGSYSEAGNSQYELTLIGKEVPEDESTKENPISLKGFPFKSEGYFFSPEGKDKDYFAFSVAEPTKFELKLSAVPGVDTSIGVWFKEDLAVEMPENVSQDQMWEYMRWPVAGADDNGISGSETLVLEAMPNMEYVVELSSSPSDYYFDYIFFFLMGGMNFESKNTNSLVPYTFTMNKISLPEDEDMYPQMFTHEEMFMEGSITIEEYKVKKRQQLEDLAEGVEPPSEEPTGEPIQGPVENPGDQPTDDPSEEPGEEVPGEEPREEPEVDEEPPAYRYYPEEMINQIVSAARPLELNKAGTGYFQFDYDEDWFTFTPDEAALFKIAANKSNTLRPNFELFAYSQKYNNLEPIAWGGSSYNWLSGEATDPEMFATLQAGKQYFIRMNNNYRASAEEYALKVSRMAEIPANGNLENKSYEKAAHLNLDEAQTDNFAMLNEKNLFYFKNRDKDQYINVKVTPKSVSYNDKLRLPAAVTGEVFPVMIVHEDTNMNNKLDPEEQGKGIVFLRLDELYDSVNAINKPVKATFKAKEQLGYFIEVLDLIYNPINFTSFDIEASVMKNLKDEDAGSKVTNNVPSKPLKLKQSGKVSTATGHLNMGIADGDKDFYEFTAAKAGKYEFKLDVPFDIDGVITVYNSKGKLVKEINYYGLGDQEIDTLSLEKDKYFIKISESAKRSSDEPYKLTVTQK